MPISSGFGYYPYHYPATVTKRVTQQPQIESRSSKESPIERRRPRRLVRVLRDAPYREYDDDDDDDDYYVDPPRRSRVVQQQQRRQRRPLSEEYVYVDAKPSSVRHRSSRRAEVVYIDEEEPIDDEDDYIYVDEDGNEVDFVNDRDHPSRHVQYIYDDEKDRRRSHKPKVIYVDDDDQPIQQGRKQKKSKQQSSTRVVYE